MGQNNSKDNSNDVSYLNKVLKTDINDVKFNSNDPDDSKRYDFVCFLKNDLYSKDNAFVNYLNMNYFLIIKYLIKVSLVCDYLNGSTQSLFHKTEDYNSLVQFKQDFEYFKKKLDKFVKYTNKEIEIYMYNLEKQTQDKKAILNKENSQQIKTEISKIIRINKIILKNSINAYIKKYSLKINNNKYSRVQLNILNIPVEMYKNV